MFNEIFIVSIIDEMIKKHYLKFDFDNPVFYHRKKFWIWSVHILLKNTKFTNSFILKIWASHLFPAITDSLTKGTWSELCELKKERNHSYALPKIVSNAPPPIYLCSIHGIFLAVIYHYLFIQAEEIHFCLRYNTYIINNMYFLGKTFCSNLKWPLYLWWILAAHFFILPRNIPVMLW